MHHKPKFGYLCIIIKIMTITKEIANAFAFDFANNLHSIEAVDDILSQKLYLLKSDKDKLLFLRFLRDRTVKNQQTHEKNGQCASYCSFDKGTKNALFILDQEIAGISQFYEPEISIEENFTTEEEGNIYSILTDILSKIDRVEKGQEIIFNEVDDLRQHFNLGKKTWTDLVVGKLTRLVGSGIMETDQAKAILKSLGDEIISPAISLLKN